MTEKMFKIGIIIFLIRVIFNSSLYGQTSERDSIKKELIGTWEFVELKDSKGIKVDTIWHNVPGIEKKGWEIPKGPLLTYNIDGTYLKQFTPQNIDNGKWYFDSKQNAIIHMLYYEKPYSSAAKYLIDKGHAKQDENGEYYEIITNKVKELTEEQLILFEREERQRVFRKINN